MKGFLLDTNVLLDVATADKVRLAWSEGRASSSDGERAHFTNPIIYAEVGAAFLDSDADLNRWCDPAVFQRLPLPYAAGWLAAHAFLYLSQQRWCKRLHRCLTFISGHFLHAAVENRTLITRDVARYQTYFPTIKLITPA